MKAHIGWQRRLTSTGMLAAGAITALVAIYGDAGVTPIAPWSVRSEARNIVVLVGSGSGPEQFRAASLSRYGRPDAQVYAHFPVRLAVPTADAPEGTHGQCGSLDRQVASALERARQSGRATGLVSSVPAADSLAAELAEQCSATDGEYAPPDVLLTRDCRDGATDCPDDQPSLPEMTRDALSTLGAAPDGFLLIVEAGAHEQMELDLAAEAVTEWVELCSDWGETLVVVLGTPESEAPARPQAAENAPDVFEALSALPRTDPSNDTGSGQVPVFAKGPTADYLAAWSRHGDATRVPCVQHGDIARLLFASIGDASS